METFKWRNDFLPGLRSLCVAVVVSFGCGEEINLPKGAWDSQPDRRWRVVETLRIGERHDGPAAFGDVQSVLADQMKRLWIVDAISSEVHVFEADGAFVRTIGGIGEGPGEFRGRIGYASLGPDEEIWVEDRARRWELFDTAGRNLGSYQIPLRQGNMPRAFTPLGVLVLRVAGTTGSVFRFYELNDGGVVKDTGRELPFPTNPHRVPVRTVRFEGTGRPRTIINIPVPYAPTGSSAIADGVALWTAAQIGTNSYQLRKWSLRDGREMLVIDHQFEPVAIPDSVRIAAADSVVERFTSGSTKLVSDFSWRMVPSHYPALQRIYVATSGELWVGRTIAEGVFGFDIFDKAGRYLGQPEVPPQLSTMRIEAITASSIYAIETDHLGIDYVVRMDVRNK